MSDVLSASQGSAMPRVRSELKVRIRPSLFDSYAYVDICIAFNSILTGFREKVMFASVLLLSFGFCTIGSPLCDSCSLKRHTPSSIYDVKMKGRYGQPQSFRSIFECKTGAF